MDICYVISGTLPDPLLNGIGIPPGMATTIGVTGHGVKRKPPPYTECSNTNREAERLDEIVQQGNMNFTFYNMVSKTCKDCLNAACTCCNAYISLLSNY